MGAMPGWLSLSRWQCCGQPSGACSGRREVQRLVRPGPGEAEQPERGGSDFLDRQSTLRFAEEIKRLRRDPVPVLPTANVDGMCVGECGPQPFGHTR